MIIVKVKLRRATRADDYASWAINQPRNGRLPRWPRGPTYLDSVAVSETRAASNRSVSDRDTRNRGGSSPHLV